MALDLLDQILPHVRDHIYPSIIPISDWKIRVGDVSNGASPSLNDANWTVVKPPQAQWGAFDTTFWFRSSVTVPAEFSGKPLVLLLDFPDGLLYINGKPYQGLDKNHRTVFLTEKARTNQTFSIAVQAYSGRKKESNVFGRADLAVLNPTARSLFVGLSFLKDLEKFYSNSPQDAKEIRELIRKTLIYLKYFKPDGEEYPNAIGRAYRFFVQNLEADLRTDVQGLVHLIGHSHLDVVWLWTFREARRKAGRTFSSMLRLMDEFHEFKFTQSQPLLYQTVKNDYPDLFKDIKRRVGEGRWEPVGAMWLEPDCNLPNGESLARHLWWGKKFLRDEFGIDSTILWLPDTFGFNWALPQLMKLSGVRYFFTTKLAWNDTTVFPHNSFWWKGIDGSKVLAHMPPVGLEGLVSARDFKKSWDQFQQKEELTEVLQTYGFGDGGGGPTKEHIENIRNFRSLPHLPPVQISTAAEFFKILEEKGKELPVWESELYLERHRGTYTTHGWIKKENRECEGLLYNAELLSSLFLLNGGKKYPVSDLERAWKLLLKNQFHDILPGTSIPDAYEEVRKDYATLRNITGEAIRRSLLNFSKPAKKSSKEFRFAFFNPLAWERDAYVEVSFKSKDKRFQVLDGEGNAVAHQILGKNKGTITLLCYFERVGACSTVSLVITPATEKKEELPVQWKITSRVLETPLYRIRIDTQGNLTSIHDKRLRRELLKKGSRANVIQTFHDTPQQWETWDIDANVENKKADLLRFKLMKVVEQGPLRVTLEVVRRSDRGSLITQHMRLYHKSPNIEFRTRVKWNDSRILVKAAFSFNLNPPAATYEIPFGSIRRSAKPKAPADKAKFEVPALQWADLSDAKFGVSLLNDGKYGYDAREGTIRLTLLRSPHYPHPVDPLKSTSAQVTDQGNQEFTYAIYPHAGDWKRGNSIRRARELNTPLITVPNAVGKPLVPLVTSLPENIVLSSVKKAETRNDLILRFYEGYGEAGKRNLEFGYGIEQAAECDLLENVTQKLKPSKGRLSMKFTPFEIKTLKIRFRPRKKR